ncbi:hypothetical protein [Fluviicola sp.]|uniref:hypothetical protein n=1 Tax=Fluviicola sp. TaxID=1917219 RepID=UPI0031E14EE8
MLKQQLERKMGQLIKSIFAGSNLFILLATSLSFGGCGNSHKESIPINQEDVYLMHITPEEFIQFLKAKPDGLYQFALDPEKISRKWVREDQVKGLKNYLSDSNSCTEVVNINLSKNLANKYNSSVRIEAEKLLKIYSEGTYLDQKVAH